MTPQTEMVVNIFGFIIAVVGFLYVVVFSHRGIRDLQRLLPSVRIEDAVRNSTQEFMKRKSESNDITNKDSDNDQDSNTPAMHRNSIGNHKEVNADCSGLKEKREMEKV
ncbi:MAG: hypothetical protein R3F48_09975 [Candidatus Zixiibacteriota bacterium]